jgi:hypothetical protein
MRENEVDAAMALWYERIRQAEDLSIFTERVRNAPRQS